MKIGLRKPSLKKSLKARTVGKWKRKAKSAFNPFYGKKGVGLLKNPSKSIKNRVYKRTTVGVNPLSASGGSKRKTTSKASPSVTKSKARDTEQVTHTPWEWGEVDKWGIIIFSIGCFIYYLVDGYNFFTALFASPLAGFFLWLLLKFFTHRSK